MNPRQGLATRAIIGSALVALATLPYLQSSGHAFLTYDDPLYVTNNPMVQRGLTWEGLGWAFTTLHACNWHPLTWLSHMADCAMFEVTPRGPLMVNIVLHALNTLLLWLVLWRMTFAHWRSAAVAAVFAVHPLHVESVVWISERKDLLSTMFGLLAIGCYLGYVRSGGAIRYLALLACFAASLLSKPMLVTLPCVLLLLDYWPLRRYPGQPLLEVEPIRRQTAEPRGKNKGQRQGKGNTGINRMNEPAASPKTQAASWQRLVLEKIPLLGMSVASSIVTVIAQNTGEALQTLRDVPMSSRITNAVVAYAGYLGKAVWPANLAVFYPRQVEMPVLSIVLCGLLLLAITVLTIWQRRQRPWLIVGWLFFLGTLVPVIGLVQVGWQSMADRYMYVPMIGLLIMILWSIPSSRTAPWRVAQAVAVCGVILLLAGLAAVQAGHWRNSVSLFERALAVTPDNHVTRCNLGNAYLEAQRPNEAIEQLQASLRLDDRTPLTHYDLGIAYQVTGRFDEALTHYRRAVELSPTYATAWANLSATLVALKQYPEAVATAEKSIECDSELAEGYASLGLALAATGQVERAIMHLRRAIDIKPRSNKTRVNLAVCLTGIGQGDEGIQQLRIAIASEPDLVEARLVLANFLEKRGEAREALMHLQHAARLKPNDAAIQQRQQRLQQSMPQESGGG